MKSIKKLFALAMIVTGVGLGTSCKKMDHYIPGGTGPDGITGPVVPVHGGITLSLTAGSTKFQEVHMNISQIEVYIQGKKESAWYTINKIPKTYDLALLSKEPAFIAASAVPPGVPTFIRISAGKGNYVVLNERAYPLEVKAERGVNIDVPNNFVIEQGKKVMIKLTADLKKSITQVSGKNRISYEMTPVISVVNEEIPDDAVGHDDETK